MNRGILCAAAVGAAFLVGACAAPAPSTEVAQAAPATKECVKTTGSNICRKAGSGNPSNVVSISGEDLRRAGGELTGAQGERIGN